MRAYILAGGFATRLWPITSSQPKPLLTIGDKPLVQHIIDAIPESVPITISVNQAIQPAFEAFLKTLARPNIDLFVEQASNDKQKRGALRAMSDLLLAHPDEDALFLGGDNYFEFSLTNFLARANENPGQPLVAAHTVATIEIAKQFGVLEIDGTHIKSFEEKPAEPKSKTIGTFCYHIPQNLFTHVYDAAQKTPDQAGALFSYLLNQSIPCHAYTFDSYWNDIGSFLDYLDVHKHINKQHAPNSLPTNTLHGAVYISPTANVQNSTIVDSIILGDAHIQDSYIEHCVIDSKTVIHNVNLVGQAIMQGVKII